MCGVSTPNIPINEKTMAWLARAGRNIEEMDHETEEVPYHKLPQSPNTSKPSSGFHNNEEQSGPLSPPKLLAQDQLRRRGIICNLLDQQSSRGPRFCLRIDPPEGEELQRWKPLQRAIRSQPDMDDRYLMPPRRQQRRRERKTTRADKEGNPVKVGKPRKNGNVNKKHKNTKMDAKIKKSVG